MPRIMANERSTSMWELMGPAFFGACSNACVTCFSALSLDQVFLKYRIDLSSGRVE